MGERVPRTSRERADLDPSLLAPCAAKPGARSFTTLMVRNIPNKYSQRKLIDELKRLGFEGCFDYVYVPLDEKTLVNVGYALVNFRDHESALKCMGALQHFEKPGRAAVSVAHVQGLSA